MTTAMPVSARDDEIGRMPILLFFFLLLLTPARRKERGISVGHPDMPEFRFKPDDARALRDYLRTIQR